MITLSQVSDIQSPDVSVIIPTYNRLSMLEEALSSVYSQDFDGVVEIIVVDDNSQDGTSEIVSQKYPDVHLISFKQNEGAYVARNRGLLEAKGKYIAFLDSDDLWEPNYLKSQVAALEGNERCFCVSNLVTWDTVKDERTTVLPRLEFLNLRGFTSPFHRLLVVGSFIWSPSSVVFPRQVFSEVGLFDEIHRLGGDTDFYIRCLLADYRVLFTELPTAIGRKHGQGRLTDIRNQELRRKTRLARADKFHPLVEKCVDIPPIERIRAEIDTHFAREYFREKFFLQWIALSIESARKDSLGYALANMLHDIRCFLKIGTRLRRIRLERLNLLKHNTPET
jgi:glycosyltransferase involved in cell wall biosynthesis